MCSSSFCQKKRERNDLLASVRTKGGYRMKKNKMRLLVIGVALFLLALIPSGDLLGQNAVDSITEAEIRDHIYFLASDALRGRDTGDIGYEIAAGYAAS